VNLLCVAF